MSLSAGGTLSYEPALDRNGADSFTSTVTGGTTSSSATVTLDVIAQPDAPVAADDSYVVLVGETVTGNVLHNDSDEDGDALSAVATPPIAQDGSFSSTTVGVFSFPYQVTDGVSSGTGTLSITVTAQPTAESSLHLRGAGATIRSSGMKADESDPTKLRWWSYSVPAGGLVLNGPVGLRLSSTTEEKAGSDLDYAAWLHHCEADRTGCALLISTVEVHVDDWSSTTTWETRTIGVGSVNATLPEGRVLRLALAVNHSDVWLALDGQHSQPPSILTRTIDWSARSPMVSLCVRHPGGCKYWSGATRERADVSPGPGGAGARACASR